MFDGVDGETARAILPGASGIHCDGDGYRQRPYSSLDRMRTIGWLEPVRSPPRLPGQIAGISEGYS